MSIRVKACWHALQNPHVAAQCTVVLRVSNQSHDQITNHSENVSCPGRPQKTASTIPRACNTVRIAHDQCTYASSRKAAVPCSSCNRFCLGRRLKTVLAGASKCTIDRVQGHFLPRILPSINALPTTVYRNNSRSRYRRATA